MTIRRVLRSIGVALLAAGVLVMLFVAYELWGTGLTTNSHQNALRSQFDQELRAHHVSPTVPTTVPKGSGSTTTTTQPISKVQPVAPPAAPGEPIGIINIPKININYVAVQGTDEADLERGPGHYSNTSLPGNPGNAAFAGHRTTYAAPFYNLDQLAPGDPIFVTTTQGKFQYNVTQVLVVDPTDVAVLDDTPTPTLTLTTCNPRYSAATRMVVKASLVSPVVAAAAVSKPRSRSGGTSAELLNSSGSWGGAVWWGLGCAAFALAVLLVHRRFRHWWVYLIGAAGFLVLLFYFFGQLNPLLPAGY
ncbi:MAG TPA: class E sortase [Acidimicrobiales bacterium]|nr:class E sortase [Acidimicrobiales bacterium]